MRRQATKEKVHAVEIDGKVFRLAKPAYPEDAQQRVAQEDSNHYNDAYLTNDGVVFYIYALVASKNQPPLDRFRQVKSIPHKIAKDLDDEQRKYALEKAAAGHLWFLHLDGGKKGNGVGWYWKAKGGARGVAAVQPVLEYLLRFSEKKLVGGVEAIHVEINNRFV